MVDCERENAVIQTFLLTPSGGWWRGFALWYGGRMALVATAPTQLASLPHEARPAVGRITHSLCSCRWALYVCFFHCLPSSHRCCYSRLLTRALSHLVVMLRRVIVVAGLEQLSRSSASLARSQCRLLLASRSSPSAPLLDKLRLHHGTKPLHRLSAAHCFSSSTTTSTVRGATLSQSINQSSWREVSMHVSHF